MISAESATKTIIAGGFTTRYLEAGQPGRPAVVLIHDGGVGTTADLCWGAVIDLLAPDFHIFAPELLGWGGTDKVVYFDRSPYAARLPHIAAFIDAVGIETACFAGVSFGGSLIMRAIVAPGNPWRIRRAVSISGAGGPYRLAAGVQVLANFKPSMDDARKLIELIVGTADGFDRYVRQLYENSLIPGHWEAMMAPGLKNPAINSPPPKDNYLDLLAGTEIPALLVAGRRDPLLEEGWAVKLAALSKRLTVRELDAGHEPNIDQPRLTADILRDFFGKEAA